MSTTTRGIDSHELVEMIERTYMRLALLDITGPMADRIATTLVLGACGLTSEQAREGAGRLFPIATRPAVRPEDTASDETNCTANERT